MLNQIAKDFDGSFSCIAQVKETNLSFSIDYLNKEKVREKFIDTLKHTQASIDTLSNNLSNGFSKNKLCVKTVKRHAYIIEIIINAMSIEK